MVPPDLRRWGLTARAGSPHNARMIISPRDGRILRLVGRFGMVSSEHIRIMEFSENRSDTPPRRVLLRLKDAGFLRRLSSRPVGGNGGGSGQYVYQLGPKGWQYLRREGKYSPYRSIDMHGLAIVDSYVATVQLERAGDIRINEVLSEPECHQTVVGVKLTPDLYINADVLAAQTRRRVWVEVDMGTERRKQITEKLGRYRHAYSGWGDARPGQPFPRVVFVAIDVERERELRTIIGEMPEQGQKLFTVCTGDKFAEIWG